MLSVAQKLGWKIQLLDARNSGDTAGDKHRVVGYAALALSS
jgi:AmmeMemoRadiSam system protein B